MFGPPISVKRDDLTIEMAPFSRDQAERIADYWRYDVIQHLSHIRGQTPESQRQFYDQVAADEDHWSWGIFVIEDGRKIHVGNTSLNIVRANIAESGILIFRRDYWGKGVASLSHAARTLFAHDELGLLSIRSFVFEDNEASRRAIEKVGYVQIGVRYGEAFRRGNYCHGAMFAWFNPTERHWKAFWGDYQPPQEIIDARARAQTALQLARQWVDY